jgi:phosphoribosylglycinamide formyltransferase 1
MTRKRVAILVSGRGSNMSALIAAAKDPTFPAEIALVISNIAGADGLRNAKAAGVPTAFVDHKIYAGREEFERSMQVLLALHRIDIVCLAGFMRLLSPWFIGRWRDRILNVHPALLPSFKGLDTHARALAAGVKIHGCTVHFVVPEVDAGPVIAQAAVPVLDDDSEATLAERVLAQEHIIYPQALAWVASAEVRVAGTVVRGPLDAASGRAWRMQAGA